MNNTGEQKNLTDIKLSKKLAYLLRHGAKNFNLSINADGYVPIAEIISIFKEFSEENIERIVKKDSKKRYSLKIEEGILKIKANQGHSIDTVNQLNLKPIDNPNFSIIHGTYFENWQSIKKQGLSRMKRNHIHFAKDLNTKCGLRQNAQVFIFINYKKATEDGIKFFESENGIILSSGNADGIIEPKYFSKVIAKNGNELF
ncbi:tRNA 2'-phosphotransferase 1 [Chelonus insularis]|uniref:tRNA 2'-phosphotransferase 1 n=1 Tax=Chelonus insularis TaxID=460826 RepID=UPI00158C1D20|nr:tRNA 2'-phosphotransferase 1 [Chelonus insularis]